MNILTSLIGFGRATVIDDSGDVQLLQVTEGAIGDGGHDLVTDQVPRVSEFGFASVPPIDSVVAVLRRCGERSRSFVFGTSHTPSRPKNLKPGDCGIYDVRGAKVMLTENGLFIDCAGLPAIVQNTTTLTIKASSKVRIEATTLEVTGDIVSRADGTAVSLNGLRDAYAAHKHTGVTAGTALTAISDHPA